MDERPTNGRTFDDVLALVRRLVGENGCPWDRAQSPESLLPYLVEEVYEIRDAVLAGDDTELAEELGDLALHLAFQSVLAEERGAFTAGDVFRNVLEKMIRRHPHVFATADAPASGADALSPGPDGGARTSVPEGPPRSADATRPTGGAAAVPMLWEEMKRRERATPAGPAGTLEGVPSGLPALLKAQRLQERAAGVGFDWADLTGPLQKLREEVDEVARQIEQPDPDRRELEEEIGDLLFAAVNVARRAGLVAETALERASAKFRRRFERVESLAAERGLDVATAGLDLLDALWDEVKRGEPRERTGTVEDRTPG